MSEIGVDERWYFFGTFDQASTTAVDSQLKPVEHEGCFESKAKAHLPEDTVQAKFAIESKRCVMSAEHDSHTYRTKTAER